MSRTKKKAFRGGRVGKHSDKIQRNNREDNRVAFDKVQKKNERFERYYNQILGLSEDERPEFWEALRRELPNSFRFTGSKSHALAVQKLLKERYIPQISAISYSDGTVVKPPEPISWYPDELAWWMTASKSVVRRFPPFSAFQKFLVSETSVGNISRQEVVSMIPPLLMDLKPGMTVLVMCAAPGSKAAQLLEMIHTGEEVRMRRSLDEHAQNDKQDTRIDKDNDESMDLDIDNGDSGRATGLLIANDSEYKRSQLLIHQLKRLSSPNLIVTNHDATMYPSIKLPPSPQNPSTNIYLKFDRILADVPCSGDGTTRKNVNLWKDWNPGSAIGLHLTQVRILVRALQMLKVGGRVVYSTCSMNPVENEAVISSAIARSGGLSKVKLLPCDEMLPSLKRKPGLRDWCVMGKTGKIWSSWNEVKTSKEKNEDLPGVDKLLPGMFAPAVGSLESQIPFQNCIRIYPHLQDTGSFFIAVLEKQSEFRTMPESESYITRSTLSDKTTQSCEIGQTSDQEISASNSSSVIMTAQENTKDGALKRSIDESSNLQNENFHFEKRLKIKETEDTMILHELKVEEISSNVHDIPKSRSEVHDKSKSQEIPQIFHDVPEIKPKAPNESKFQESPSIFHDLPSIKSEAHNNVSSQIRPNRNRYGALEEPFNYISKNHAEVQAIESFYKLSSRFPRDRFMVRNSMGHPAKIIYYTSSLVRDVLTENQGHGIKFIHGGVKMFMKQDVQGPDVCKWRIQSEGMPILEGYVGEERVVYLNKKETLKKLLIEMFPKVADGAWQELGEIGEQVRNIGMGCLVLRINLSSEDGTTEKTVLPLWRSAASLNLMLSKEDRTALLLRIFNDNSSLINHLKEAKKASVEEVSKKDHEDQIEINNVLVVGSELEENETDPESIVVKTS